LDFLIKQRVAPIKLQASGGGGGGGLAETARVELMNTIKQQS
jgi:hypothetical protein